MTRTLETLIEQFNRASEIDRFSQAFIGDILWAEVDGVCTTMVNSWLNELSSEEKADFDAHVAKVVRDAALRLGYESSYDWFYDIGKKMFDGLKAGLNTS